MGKIDLSVELAPGNRNGLKLDNPLILASGTCGYVAELDGRIDIGLPGAFVCKGTTLEPRQGNRQPRIAETGEGMLNSIGLENIGIQSLINKKAPAWRKLDICVLVNIAGSTVDEYVEAARRLEGVSGVKGIELNISCPNIRSGGVEFGVDPGAAAGITRSVRKATSLPLVVKLSPEAGRIEEVALQVTDAGADAISLINTFKGMAIDIRKRRPLIGNTTGGLSGPVIKPVALAMVYRVAAMINIPVIACGGIASAGDALEFIMAGATAFQLGTAFLVEPDCPARILDGIKKFMAEERLESIREIIGAANPGLN